MEEHAHFDILPGGTSEVSPLYGQPASMSRQSRRDTGSSLDSGSTKSMPPGFYSIPIHGNCPRCHHYHKAAIIKISGDATHVEKVDCENCGSRWLGFGGRNSTCISLLSTLTDDLEPEEKQVRETLINMVRSVTSMGSIASPTAALASVPELPSPGPSREHSVRRPRDQGSNIATAATAAPESGRQQSIQRDMDRSDAGLPQRTRATTMDTATSLNVKPLAFVGNVKRRLRNRFPVLDRVHVRKIIRSMKRPRVTDKAKGKLPVTQDPSRDDSFWGQDPSRVQAGLRGQRENHPRRDPRPYPRRLSRSKQEQDLETLKSLTKEDRIIWLRTQMGDRKCPCSKDCYCRDAEVAHDAPSTADDPLATDPTPEAPAVQRRSLEYLFSGIGSHFPPGTFLHRSRPISIESTTRFSQAATALNSDSMTVTSGPTARPLLAPQHQQRQRSRSPRPVSLPPGSRSPLRQSTGIDDFEDRSSMDSFATDRAVRSASRNRPLATRYSSTSLPQPSLSHNDTMDYAASLQSQDTTPRQPPAPLNGYESAGPSTPRINGD
ncbi:hypothetical protein K491DRAFT_675054 [Lophiostoma macrostomum CBS 122681]|uniref:Uncharacterized protein n=1 Tax=Lophiostoma macrostomum CBS 122681 TaxID=1314788 RepID=A0A6A6TLD4_9PLEO|nr:hypothetical protein K491DRAFT_675054 [Lophiostoma macrostomum CBS 122681]